jgi:hypothetical protein
MACPTTGIRDFPLLNSYTPSEELNQKIQETYLTDLRWSPRKNAPSFVEPLGSGIFNEGGSFSTSPTTFRLNGNEYTLIRAQFCDTLHTNFILPPANESKKQMEILLMFQNTSGDAQERFLTFCIPVLQTETAIQNEYIDALLENKLPGKPIPASSLLPPPGQQQFLSYATCLSTTGAQKTSRVFMRVFYFIKGLFLTTGKIQEIQGRRLGVSISRLRLQNDLPSLMIQIQRIQNLTGIPPPNINTVASGINYILSLPLPKPQLLGSAIAQRQNQLLTRISDEPSYLSFLVYSQITTTAKEATPIRSDSTDSYKCVPLNPSTNLKGGRLEVNLDTGELLTQVLEKNEVRQKESPGLTPGQVEKIVGIALGVIFGTLVLCIFAYLLARSTSTGFEQPVFEIPNWLKTMTPLLFVGVIAGVIGYFIGVFS